jgi:protein TonB
VVDVSQVRIPEVSAGPTLGPDRFVIGLGVDDVGVGGSPIAGSGMGGDPVDERLVERSPRMVGRVPEPRFPAMLRAAGIEGRVLVQLVVDTLGRAEPDGVQIVEASHPLFAEAVREVLPRYRFTPGEVGGRKVRTRVQIPFAFTLRP